LGGDAAIHDRLQLERPLLGLVREPARVQILRRALHVAGVGRLDEAEDRPLGHVAPEGILAGGRSVGRLGAGTPGVCPDAAEASITLSKSIVTVTRGTI
jgi:hypothetical protein